MPFAYKENNHELERKVLSRIILISSLVIIGYLSYDLFRQKKGVSWEASIFVFSLYMVSYFVVKYSSRFVLVRRLVSSFFSLSMVSGFFVLNGFQGMATLDIANMFVLIPLIFRGIERKVMTGVYVSIVLFFCFVQGFHPEWIVDSRQGDEPWFDTLEVIFRFITAYNLGYTTKSEYDKEYDLVQQMNFDLQELNEEISSQNEEIIQQREEILVINESLEELVEKRTQKIIEQNGRLLEYAFFNAHKVRGPLARILGLVKVTKLLKEKKEDKEQYFDLIEESAIELDNVVKEINIILSDQSKMLGSE